MDTFETGNSGQFSEELRDKLSGILNQQLADTVDLRLQVRQGYWNLRGRYAPELRLLFDGLARELRQFIDLIADRICVFGGCATASVRIAAQRSSLRNYPADALEAHDHVEALLSSYSKYEVGALKATKDIEELRDFQTVGLLLEICNAVEKNLWFLEAYLEAIAVGSTGGRLPRWTSAFEDPRQRSNHFAGPAGVQTPGIGGGGRH
ncbi:MAG: DNA starvation/stationary phase protection protein Dps [Acidobacteria bacterium]|nr:MAG: DNA starvation/stationary phase protection protein Dps [Acidobacteriota bacterium]